MSDSDVDTAPGAAAPHPRIRKDENVLGGAARIQGTRVRVSDIVVDYHYHGLSPEDIAEEYPAISLADVYAALSYFTDHTTGIRDEIRERERTFAHAKGG